MTDEQPSRRPRRPSRPKAGASSSAKRSPKPSARALPEPEIEILDPLEPEPASTGSLEPDAVEIDVSEIEPVEIDPDLQPESARSGDPGAGAGADEAGLPEPVAGLPVQIDSLQRYLSEIRRYPLLNVEEEHGLAVRWREEGDRAAGMRLVTANLRLVVMIARQYQRAFRNLLDLIQEGNIGLLEAVKNFDPYRGVRFPSYAAWWIRAYIIRYVMNNWRMVKVGTTQAQRKLFFNLQREKDRLEREGFRPDPVLIAERLSVKESEVVEMEQRLGSREMSVDAPMGEDGDSSMLDFLPDGRNDTEAAVANAEARNLIMTKIREFGATLRDKEKLIFDRRMITDEPLTLQEIGEEYNISRERVRQLEERIRKRLGAYLKAEIPDIDDVDVRMGLGGRSS